jgi:hypothetical protein
MLKVAVTFCGMKATYIYLIWHELSCFTTSLIHEIRLRKRNDNQTHLACLCYMLEFVYQELG